MVVSDYLAKTPIGTTGGFFYLTQPQDRIYLLEFDSPPDNRLTTNFIEAFLFSLDIVEQRFPKGVLVTTSKIAKFYSNGLDLDHLRATPQFLEKWLFPLFRRLLAYPMPTLALINGHAFAGGLIIAMYHDYRVMNPAKGYLCLNEVLFGAVMDSPMLAIFRQKVTNPNTYRSLVLEGHRFPAKQALAEGLVDVAGGWDEALTLIKERDLTKKGEAGVYRQLKEEMYRDTLWYLRNHAESVKWRETLEKEKAEHSKKALADMTKSRIYAKY